MTDRNKIAQSLSVEELDKFIRELAKLPGSERTLEKIQEKAGALGISISLMSARAFRKTTFANYLKRTERRREFAERITATPSTGAQFADAAAENLAELVFDMTEELADVIDEGGKLDLKKASTTAFIISKIRQGDVARGKLQLQVDEYERKERERAEKTAAAARELEKLRDPGAQLNKEERDAVLSTIDDLLGIRKA